MTIFDRGCQAVTAITLVIALISMAAQIFSRYVIGSSLVWSEELARYALIWSAMVGSAVAYREGSHIGITLLVDMCPERLRKFVFRLVHAMVLVFAGVIAWHGWFLAWRNFERHQLSAAMQIEIAWPYMAIPVGACLIMITAAGALWQGTRTTRILKEDA